MARKKRAKKSWVRLLVFFVVTPFVVWFVAFLLWFYGPDLGRLFGRNAAQPTPSKANRQVEKNDARERAAPAQEKIFEEDRQKLEDILKRRN